MPFLHETTYDINPGQFDAFQAWLRVNEDDVAASYPEGAEYIGTFASVFGDRSRGGYRTLVKLQTYGMLDTIAEEVAKEGALARLLWEMSAFTVAGSLSRGRTELWKRAQFKVATGD